MRHNVADESGVRVMAEKCPTCIFRPGNPMGLHRGRVGEMLAQVRKNDSCISCHETLDDEKQAVCRGQFDVLKTQPLQIAERLDMIVWHPPKGG